MAKLWGEGKREQTAAPSPGERTDAPCPINRSALYNNLSPAITHILGIDLLNAIHFQP